MFPKKYTKYGRFKLHSGETSDVFYDVVAYLTDNMRLVYDAIHSLCESADMWVGIVTGGALIACQNDSFGIVHGKRFIGERRSYILIDDVVTTESSIREAIEIIGKEPKDIFCVVDRRKNPVLQIKSLYKV